MASRKEIENTQGLVTHTLKELVNDYRVKAEYDKNGNLCYEEYKDGRSTGISIKEKVSSDENSIDIHKLEIVCDNYPNDTILRGLTLEQKDMICDYVEQTIDYGYANKISDNIGNLYNSIIEERGKETEDISNEELDEPDICDED